jgi:hypothetical protein
MAYLARLRDAVLAELAAGRLGEPVFVREILAVSPDHGHLLRAAAEGVAFAAEALRAPAESLLALGSVEAGHLSVQADHARGLSSLVAVAVERGGSPRLDLLLLGSRGSLHHEVSPERLALEVGEGAAQLLGAPSEAARLAEAAISGSLRSREPVRLARES